MEDKNPDGKNNCRDAVLSDSSKHVVVVIVVTAASNWSVLFRNSAEITIVARNSADIAIVYKVFA